MENEVLNTLLNRSSHDLVYGNKIYPDCLCLLVGKRILFFDEERCYIGSRRATDEEYRNLDSPHPLTNFD